MSEFGWEIYNESGILVADNSVIMSRRLGIYAIPFVASAWSITIPVSLNGGTPFAHCHAAGNPLPGDVAYRVVAPDINFNSSGTQMTISYDARHFAWPMDDAGISNVRLGDIVINYGVYNQ